MVTSDWKELTDLTRGEEVVVERVRLAQKDIAIEGRFTLPPLARLTSEDQVFVASFIRTHGSIKEMEKLFGVSYPTIKGRLTRIAEALPFTEINPPPTRQDILDQLEQGAINVSEALERLK